jgi:hypothetical protein
LQRDTFSQPGGLDQRSTLNQSDFTQRTAIEQQRLLDQQQSAALRTQQSELGRGQSQFSDQQMLNERARLGEQQTAGRQGDIRDQSMLRGEISQRSDQRIAATGAPGELGVFVGEGTGRGVLISRVVTGSAAFDAGLRSGDIIVAVAEQPITVPSDLTRLIRAIPAGEVASLQVIRGDAEYDVDATLRPLRSQASYGVGYRGSETVVSGDLSTRVSRLEEQLATVLNELRSIRQEVVILRGGSSEATGFDARLRAGETRTGMETEFGERATRNGIGAELQRSETRQFNERSTQSGLGTDVNQRGPVSGVDARSDTRIDARSTQPGAAQRDADATDAGPGATGRGATQPSTDDDPLGLNATPPQDEQRQNDEQEKQSQTESDQALPF